MAIGLWWLATTVLAAPDSLVRAFAPQDVLPALWGLLERGVLLPDIGASMYRLLVGLLIALAALVTLTAAGCADGNTTANPAGRPTRQWRVTRR